MSKAGLLLANQGTHTGAEKFSFATITKKRKHVHFLLTHFNLSQTTKEHQSRTSTRRYIATTGKLNGNPKKEAIHNIGLKDVLNNTIKSKSLAFVSEKAFAIIIMEATSIITEDRKPPKI